MGYRVFAVFVFLAMIAFYCALWWYYHRHRCGPTHIPQR